MIISIVFLTSIVQSGLPFQVFSQALTINGFTGAVMSATFGPDGIPIAELFGLVQARALVVSMKEIYGWLLIAGLFSLLIILLSYSPLRPAAIFPKWKTIRRTLRHIVRLQQ